MAFLSVFNKKNDSVSLLFDIGSSSIGAALVEFKNGAIPKVLYATREPFAFQKELHSARLTAAMREALQNVILHVEKYGVVHLNFSGLRQLKISEVSCIFSSPWYSSKTKLIKVKKDGAFIVSRPLLKSVMDQEEKDFEDDFLKSSSGLMRDQLEIIDQKIIQMRLNGYPTAKPYGKTAQEIEATLFVSLIQKETSSVIRDAITRRFNVRHIAFHTLPLAAFATLRNIFPNNDNFLFMEIGGELSEMTIVKKGVISETLSFPIGGNFILRKLGDEGDDGTHHITRSLIALYAEGKAEQEISKKVSADLDQAEADWLSLFYDALSDFSEETFLPKSLFLIAEPAYLEIFLAFIKKGEFSQFTLTGEPFDVTRLEADTLKNVAEFANRTTFDPFIALESAFLASFPREYGTV